MKEQTTNRNKVFCVLGLSTFGTRTAINLCENGAQVLVIDKNEEKIKSIANKVTRAVQADVLDEEVMKSLGVLDIDVAIIGLKDLFDVSVLLVQFLKESGVKTIFAQVDSNAKEKVLRKLGATTVVFPERDIAEKISQNLLIPSIVDHIPLGSDASIVELKCPQKYIGKSLIELDLRKKYEIHIIGIKSREDKKNIVVTRIAPAPGNIFRKGDIMLVLGHAKKLNKFTREIEENNKQ